MPRDLRPHAATYAFLNGDGGQTGEERMRISLRDGGWLATSHLELQGPESLSADIEWHLNPDLSTHVIYLWSRDHWSQEHHLEAAVTGNGLLASRRAPDGPTQVEMGWGPEVQLDHMSACFSTVLLARLHLDPGLPRRVKSVYIGAEDLVPEPLEQEYRLISGDPAWAIDGDSVVAKTVERLVPGTGSRARLTVLEGGVLAEYEGLCRLTADWGYTDTAAGLPTK